MPTLEHARRIEAGGFDCAQAVRLGHPHELRLAAELIDMVHLGGREGAGDTRVSVGPQQVLHDAEDLGGLLEVLNQKTADDGVGAVFLQLAEVQGVA